VTAASTGLVTGAPPGPRWGETAGLTAVRVLEWAAAPVGPPPMGTLRQAGEVLSAPAVRDRLGALVRSASARLGAGNPPFGDTSAVGAGAVLLAASIGGRAQPEPAAKLAAALPPAHLDESVGSGWADALARHAVVAAALEVRSDSAASGGSVPSGGSAASTDVANAWLDASPLTAVLLAPQPDGRRTALRTAQALAGRPNGPAALTAVLSACHPDARVIGWRGEVLLRLATQRPQEVLDVYLAARLRHAAAWDTRISEAAHRLGAAVRSGHSDADALAVVHYWAGLGVRQVADLVTAGRLPVDLRPMLTLLRRHPSAGVSER
jgi:hypothetical protein